LAPNTRGGAWPDAAPVGSALNPLPGGERAVIEESKLVDYTLNPHSEDGRHKARVFESALGFNLSNWIQLKQAILAALPHHPAALTSETALGRKYEALLAITAPNGRSVGGLTVWQFDPLPNGTLNDQPHLVTLSIP
jgi:hypothetical protein